MHLIIAPIPTDDEQHWDKLFEQGLARLDEASRTKIKRYHRKEDAWRTLLGRLIVVTLFATKGVKREDLSLCFTSSNKPFILPPEAADTRIAFNISHDHMLVVVGYETDTYDELCLGVDMMHVKLPQDTTLESFIDILTDSLSPKELDDLRSSLKKDPPGATLKHIFWIWTFKEAYTKAIGQGLGFELNRISVDPSALTIQIDGSTLTGYEFMMFEVKFHGPGSDIQNYQGVLAKRLKDNKTPVRIRRKIGEWGEPYRWADSVTTWGVVTQTKYYGLGLGQTDF
ncbi:uncharacterized protein EI90DRAFT_3187854 [Cantharellus anzutake]|uniref:uncharacterized protein n=1 Tax=Cantharellus anzutake TaxID=1750568 RepID=UPI001902FEFB|nr:uncharacterized protein EI90DRAFT_3187854 [Cantharellus anzutake]KAF8332711.1 hypothetical protein EI90DRAFT_3187854 [Cantharellus anzutake]